uniref:Uncharacterized protein n=1 Tax=Rhizophora mucronata TaxID=61149 RepID=A0A2P2PHI5_RHIMU
MNVNIIIISIISISSF